jgi:succinate-acetate transporter protein
MASNHMVANPAPLGFAAFGITNFLLSSQNAGLWHNAGGSAMIGTALAFGGAIGLLVSIMEFLRGDAIGATFFGSFGAFWLSLFYFVTHPATQAPGALGVLILGFAVANFIFWMAVMKRSIQHNLFGALLTITLILLSYGNWAGGHSGAVKTGGWFGLATALVALYMGAKALINEEYGSALLP